MAAHLSPREPGGSAAGELLPRAAPLQRAVDTIPVLLVDAEGASGLADMLHQFLQQTLAESPRKRRQARALIGRAVFRSAEDEAVCVAITFAGDSIELRDGPAADAPSVSADFLSLAHLTSGQENPYVLLARGRMKARFTLRQVPFLLRLLRVMRIESAARNAASRRRWVLVGAATAVVAAGAYWYVSRAP